jgi:hypothetical protein
MNEIIVEPRVGQQVPGTRIDPRGGQCGLDAAAVDDRPGDDLRVRRNSPWPAGRTDPDDRSIVLHRNHRRHVH